MPSDHRRLPNIRVPVGTCRSRRVASAHGGRPAGFPVVVCCIAASRLSIRVICVGQISRARGDGLCRQGRARIMLVAKRASVPLFAKEAESICNLTGPGRKEVMIKASRKFDSPLAVRSERGASDGIPLLAWKEGELPCCVYRREIR